MDIGRDDVRQHRHRCNGFFQGEIGAGHQPCQKGSDGHGAGGNAERDGKRVIERTKQRVFGKGAGKYPPPVEKRKFPRIGISRQANIGELPYKRVLRHFGKRQENDEEQNRQQHQRNDDMRPADVVFKPAVSY